MADPVEVDRYDLEPVDSLGTAYTIGGEPSPTGEACMWDDIAPLLAELATLRERTRRRDAATEPPAVGEWVLGQRRGRSKLRVVVELNAHRIWKDNHGWTRDITAWWPLPPTGE